MHPSRIVANQFICHNKRCKYAAKAVYFFSHGLFLVLGFGYPVLFRTGFFLRQPRAPVFRKNSWVSLAGTAMCFIVLDYVQAASGSVKIAVKTALYGLMFAIPILLNIDWNN